MIVLWLLCPEARPQQGPASLPNHYKVGSGVQEQKKTYLIPRERETIRAWVGDDDWLQPLLSGTLRWLYYPTN